MAHSIYSSLFTFTKFFFHLVISIFNQRTDQSSGSEVNLNVSYFKKLKPLEIGNFNSQVFFLILL